MPGGHGEAKSQSKTKVFLAGGIHSVAGVRAGIYQPGFASFRRSKGNFGRPFVRRQPTVTVPQKSKTGWKRFSPRTRLRTADKRHTMQPSRRNKFLAEIPYSRRNRGFPSRTLPVTGF